MLKRTGPAFIFWFSCTFCTYFDTRRWVRVRSEKTFVLAHDISLRCDRPDGRLMSAALENVGEKVPKRFFTPGI